MTKLFLSIVALLLPADSFGALYMFEAGPPFNASRFVVASNESEAVEVIQKMGNPYNFPPQWELARACKPGGWFAYVAGGVNGDGGPGRYAGACNFSTRQAAKKAAVNACMQKVGCKATFSGMGGTLVSGFDDSKFRALENIDEGNSLRSREIWNWSRFPKTESCKIADKDHPNPPTNCTSGYKTAIEISQIGYRDPALQTVPFDPQSITVSPWDK